MALATIYFVVFHGMEGKTVGKWLLGLRVVGVNQRPITYRRALLRWIGTDRLGRRVIGIGFPVDFVAARKARLARLSRAHLGDSGVNSRTDKRHE